MGLQSTTPNSNPTPLLGKPIPYPLTQGDFGVAILTKF